MDAIKTVNLTKSYGKVRGIKNLNLTVSEGDFFGFIGPNGAGKSTTIHTLLGLIRPRQEAHLSWEWIFRRTEKKSLAVSAIFLQNLLFIREYG